MTVTQEAPVAAARTPAAAEPDTARKHASLVAHGADRPSIVAAGTRR